MVGYERCYLSMTRRKLPASVNTLYHYILLSCCSLYFRCLRFITKGLKDQIKLKVKGNKK